VRDVWSEGDCVSPAMRSALGGAPARLLSAATGRAATTAPAGGAGGDSRWHALQEGGSNCLGSPRASSPQDPHSLCLKRVHPGAWLPTGDEPATVDIAATCEGAAACRRRAAARTTTEAMGAEIGLC
jgi:hypothetical protein